MRRGDARGVAGVFKSEAADLVFVARWEHDQGERLLAPWKRANRPKVIVRWISGNIRPWRLARSMSFESAYRVGMARGTGIVSGQKELIRRGI